MSRFDLGKVEKVVDQSGKAIGIRLDAVKISNLLFVQRTRETVEHIVNRSLNRRQWSPELERDVVPKVRVQFIQLLQPSLISLFFGDVLSYAQKANDLSVKIPDR